MSKDTGYKTLLKEAKNSFIKWGEYMKRAIVAERKVAKLKALLLLTDKSVAHIIVSETQLIQWSEFLKEFPDEIPSEARDERE